MPNPILSKIATSSQVTRFRGTPQELRATLSDDVARCVTYVATPRNWDTHYRYSLHMDRTAAYKATNRGDNSVRLLVGEP